METLQGKVILITGATDGIGKQTAWELAALGGTILVHGRNAERGMLVLDEIKKGTGNPNVDLFVADFSSLRQVRQLATDIQSRYDRLHVLINNAGIFMNERRLSEDGFELTFAVNHLAPFLLTHSLLSLLKKSAPARVITVSSVAHTRGRLDFTDLQSEKQFNGYGAYALSKLANVLFTFELAERLNGSGVTANCLHPGVIGTKLLRTGFNISGASLKEGAATSVHLASAPELERVTGKYFANKREMEPSAMTRDRLLRGEFWNISE